MLHHTILSPLELHPVATLYFGRLNGSQYKSMLKHFFRQQRCCSFGAQNGGCCRVGSDCPSDVDAGLEKRWDQLEVFHVEYSPLAVGETEGHRRWTVAQSACPDGPLGVLLWHNLPHSCHKNKPRSVIITCREGLEDTQEQL